MGQSFYEKTSLCDRRHHGSRQDYSLQYFKEKIENSVFLDGDWCWNMEPFQVTEETKAMVMNNITHILNNFLACSAYDHVIFCWVLHEQEILDTLLSRLGLPECRSSSVFPDP